MAVDKELSTTRKEDPSRATCTKTHDLQIGVVTMADILAQWGSRPRRATNGPVLRGTMNGWDDMPGIVSREGERTEPELQGTTGGVDDAQRSIVAARWSRVVSQGGAGGKCARRRKSRIRFQYDRTDRRVRRCGRAPEHGQAENRSVAVTGFPFGMEARRSVANRTLHQVRADPRTRSSRASEGIQ